MNAQAGQREPGWYYDPQVVGLRRYWDGQAWTGHTAPPPPPGAGASDSLVAVTFILAIFLPFVGFILAIVVMAKGRVGAGLAALLLSIAVVMIALSTV